MVHDLARSAAIGEVITILVLAVLHKEMNAGQVITFWVSVHMISTCAVDWTIDTIKNAVTLSRSNHGDR